MRGLFRIVAAGLLLGLASPLPALAGGALGEDPYEIAEKLRARKKHKTALAYFRKALDRNDARAHYGMALTYEETGRDRDALTHYRRYVDAAPPEDARRIDAARRLATIEERSRREAAQTGEALERGKSLYARGRYREAEKALRQAAAKDDTLAEAHFYLGEVYMKLEKYDQANAEYRRAKRLY